MVVSNGPIGDLEKPSFDGFTGMRSTQTENRIAKVLALRATAEESPVAQRKSGASRRLISVLETAVEAIVMIDERGVVETFNRAAVRMFGYAREEIIGQNVSLLMPEPYRARHDHYIQNYLATGQAGIIGIGREAVGRRKDGTSFPIELAVSEVIEGHRRIFTGIIRDLSERRQLEAEVLDASEREQQRIGHELHDGLCQELSGIAFAVRALQQKAQARQAIDPAEVAKVTNLLQDAVRHTRGLSRSLRPVDAQPNGLHVALSQLAVDASDRLGVSCTFEGEHTMEVRSPATATRLYRIAQEAVREAVGYGNADRVVIGLARKRNLIVLSVTDNGTSLSQDGRYRHDKMVIRMMNHRSRVIGAKLQLSDGPDGRGVRLICELNVST